MPKIKIIGVGSYLPKKVVSNFDLEKVIETSNDWIVKRTGIYNRHIALKDENTSDLAVNAIKLAIDNTKIEKDEIEAIICATSTPDLTFPSTACIIQQKLDIKKPIIAFDLQAACSGFIYALSVMNDIMKSKKIKKAIVVGAEKMSSIVDWSDRSTCVLFGDGAGAFILQNANEDDDSFIIDTDINADGNFNNILCTSGGVSNENNKELKNFEGDFVKRTSGAIKMNGQAVFKHAVEKMSSSINNIVKRNKYTLDDISLIVPHQANYRILHLVSEKLGIPYEKFMLTINEHANTSSASIPLAFDVALKTNKIKKGDLIVLEAIGAGLTWGSVLIRL